MTGELDQRTRTMLVEVDVDNSDNFLVPGSFAYLIAARAAGQPAADPGDRAADARRAELVAMVDGETVRFRPVKVASTDGATVTVSEGVKPGDKVAINVPDEVTDGSRIQPVAASR